MTFSLPRRTFLAASMTGAAGFSAAAAEDAAPPLPWPERREGIRAAWLDLLGPFPETIPPLEPDVKPADPIDGIPCRYVTFQTEPGERVPGYLLVPESDDNAPRPAVLCIHPTTGGPGKRVAVGLEGSTPGDPPAPPERSRAYALELARWGYVTFAIDLMCDGERIPEGLPRYDTRRFYERRPEWSAVGKNAWDAMRAIDFLRTLDFVDPNRIACCGHSLGGHSSLFAAAFDERIAAAVCNGGVYSWRRNEDHWSRPETAVPQPVTSYIYIKRFRPYLDDPAKPVPADFDGLMALVAPRPLLLMQTENEFKQDDTVAKASRAAEIYRALDAGDRLALFDYPGDHNYPPDAKRFSFAWLDRWLGHTPDVPTIWPGQCV